MHKISSVGNKVAKIPWLKELFNSECMKFNKDINFIQGKKLLSYFFYLSHDIDNYDNDNEDYLNSHLEIDFRPLSFKKAHNI